MKSFLLIICMMSLSFVQPDSMIANGFKIYRILMIKLWNINAISAVLGIMQAESGIMPTLENREGEGSYGLIQWTPKSKLLERANYVDYDTIEKQCEIIDEDVRQFDLVDSQDFRYSKASPEILADIFYRHYYQNAKTKDIIKTFARKWHDRLKVIDGRRVEYYVIQPGDTLDVIAKRFGYSGHNDLYPMNPGLTEFTILEINQRIRIYY